MDYGVIFSFFHFIIELSFQYPTIRTVRCAFVWYELIAI